MAMIPAKWYCKQGSKMETGARKTRETVDYEEREERLVARL